MKRALLIGIDDYDNFQSLVGCVNDVRAVKPLLARHEDGSPNFDCHTLTSNNVRVERRVVLEAIAKLLSPGADHALFFFAGHGAGFKGDVVLVSQDGSGTDLGVALSEILGKVQKSSVNEITLLLDCCFSGAAGGVPQLGTESAVLKEGVALLSASRRDQPAAETSAGRGAFSDYLGGGLQGGAADVLGKVTLAGLYAYLSESFGPWDQRPTFKAHLDRLHEIRRCSPAVPLAELRRLPEFFPDLHGEYQLDPSYEPDADPDHLEHETIFGILQRCRAAKLVEPVGEDHMYYAAMNSKSCRLTPLGRLYCRMAGKGRL